MKGVNNMVIQNEKKEIKFRYFCDGCTKIAFYGTDPFNWYGERACAECSKMLEYKPENWIRLNPGEQVKN